MSQATDALMDHLGLDAAYRTRTHCTLYTLEMHIHYLQEVKQLGHRGGAACGSSAPTTSAFMRPLICVRGTDGRLPRPPK